MGRVEPVTDEMFDVVVVGGGPAGATAATLLARKEHAVALVEASSSRADDTSLFWLSPKAYETLCELGVKKKALPVTPFSDVTFRTSDFQKTAKPAFDGVAGYLAHRGEMYETLIAVAKSAGATVMRGQPAKDVKLGEAAASVLFEDGTQASGKLLMLASGRESPLLSRCGFVRSRGSMLFWTAQVDHLVEEKFAVDKPAVDVVLGLDRGASFGLICRTGRHVAMSIHWAGERLEAVPLLIGLCRLAHDNELVPNDLSKMAARARFVASPASVALDMDTHVGKHTLLIGDAGGFVAAASNEGVYPAMWSAQIATEVAEASFQSVYSQDELMTFDSKWRIQMADYLRSPNTDTQFLLPLIFSNQSMADRMGAAFFAGENI